MGAMDSVLVSRTLDGDPQRGFGSEDRPAIGELELILRSAIDAGASDVHIEPARGCGIVRCRVDGVLAEIRKLNPSLHAQVVSRVKLLAGMDIADKRQPQDGRYSLVSAGREVDARVSSMPTSAGEKLVIRLLDHGARVPDIADIGMPPAMLSRFRSLVLAPHGFVVVTGPTGSGKTTTAYAALLQRDVTRENLCSVEDPVEVALPGVAQVQVNLKAGVTFASALRALLRQDPNAILIGEMRDGETAAVAARAAMSGQLVLTTLHSNDAPTALDRIAGLGVAPSTIASALTAIVAQRLVRKICTVCRREDGCDACGRTGYSGRAALFECLFLDDALRRLVASGAPSLSVAQAARESGFAGLHAAGAQALSAGVTTRAELRRVLPPEGAAW